MLQRRLRALERAVFQQASVAEEAKVTIFLPHNGRGQSRPLIVSGVPFAFAELYCGQKASR